MRRFYSFSKRYVKPYAWWYIGGFALVAVTQFLAVAIIEVTRNAIDAFELQGPTSEIIWTSLVRIALLATGMILIRITSRLLVFTPGRLIEYRVRNDYFSRLLYLTRVFYRNHETGDLVSRCSNDIGYVRAAYGYAFLQVANVGTAFALGIGAMLRMDVRMTVTLAIPMLIAFVIIQSSIQYMFGFWRVANTQLGQLSSLCLASYKGVSAVQSYCAEPAFERAFLESNQNYLHTNMTLTKVRAFIMPLVQVVGNLAAFLVLWLAGSRAIDGQVTMGEITAFMGYIAMVMPPLLSLGWMLNVFNRAVPAMERLDEILLAEIEPESITSPQDQPSLPLVVNHLQWQYSDSEKVLDGIQFSLEPGKVMGIVGAVGSGKTTLIETILRLNDPDRGSVFVGDHDARDFRLNEYRSMFSFAPQKAFLFSATLRENLLVALGAELDSKDHDEQLIQTLDLCGFDLDPDVFPEGLDTQVGEKGIMLSGGQRQRISLTRALLKNADVYVLDDVLSAVDHETEQRIIANLKSFAKNRCVVIASHRVSAVKWADQILVLNQGKTEAMGTHEELMALPGYYQSIAKAQQDSA
ncbi:MAG: ABC transporter ATP-binding protein [Acidobacteria bacterium]|nr:ABC transporter ATP-binding protein [Acidobacteriota bacterium]